MNSLIDHINEMNAGDTLIIQKTLGGSWIVIDTSIQSGIANAGFGATLDEAILNEQED